MMMFMVGFCHSTNRFLLDTQMNWYRFVHGIWDVHKWFLLFHSFNENKADFLLQKKPRKITTSRITIIFFLILSDLADQQKLRKSTSEVFGFRSTSPRSCCSDASMKWPVAETVVLGRVCARRCRGKAVKGEVFWWFLCRKKTHCDRKQNQRC